MSPNYNNSVSAYDLYCPDGFVFPENPYSKYNKWVANSSCAESCLAPVYTKATYAARKDMITLFSWFGAISIGILIVTHLKEGKALGYLTRCTLYYASILSLTFIIAGNFTLEQQFCYDNSSTITQNNGFTFCAFQAVVCCYSGVGIVMVW